MMLSLAVQEPPLIVSRGFDPNWPHQCSWTSYTPCTDYVTSGLQLDLFLLLSKRFPHAES